MTANKKKYYLSCLFKRHSAIIIMDTDAYFSETRIFYLSSKGPNTHFQNGNHIDLRELTSEKHLIHFIQYFFFSYGMMYNA